MNAEPASVHESPATMETQGSSPSPSPRELDWPGFVEFCQDRKEDVGLECMFLQQVRGFVENDYIRIFCSKEFVYQQCSRHETLAGLRQLAAEWAGRSMDVQVEPPREKNHLSPGEVREKALADPLVKEVMDSFGAQVVDIRQH